MKVLKIIIIGSSFVFLALLGILVWFFFSGGIFSDCETHEISRSKSPSGKYEAMVYIKGCGATTPSATIVALRQDEKVSAFEDIFIIEAAVSIDFEWTGPDQLKIFSPKIITNADIFRKEMNWQTVSIEYQ